MIHLYCGDGKGKTTCAFGLALRACGRGLPVVVAQFLKGDDSGERRALERLPGVTLLDIPQRARFSFQMNGAEKAAARARFSRLMDQVSALVEGGEARMVVLDECCAAINTGLLPLERVTAFLDRCQAGPEVVLTGRNPDPALVERADYVTEMRKVRHPYDRGTAAREGIEF